MIRGSGARCWEVITPAASRLMLFWKTVEDAPSPRRSSELPANAQRWKRPKFRLLVQEVVHPDDRHQHATDKTKSPPMVIHQRR